MATDRDAEIAKLQKENEEMAAKLRKLETKIESFQELEEDGRCPVCQLNYSRLDRFPMVGKCGHTICERCYQMIRYDKCPICRDGISFTHPSKNFLAYALLEKSNLLEGTIDVNNTILILGKPKGDSQRKSRPEVTGMFLNANRTEWIEIQFKLPYNTYGGGAVYLNGEIYIFGGENNPKNAYKLEENLKWVRLADMNIGRSWMTNSSLIWNGCIWVMGGKDPDGKCLKSVEKYDPQEDKWTLMPDMIHPRAYAAAVLGNTGIHISGGASDDGITNTKEKFEEESWIELSDRSEHIFAHSLVCYKEQLLMLTKNDEYRGYEESRYADRDSTWKPLRTATPTDTCAGIVLDNEIYAVGGWNYMLSAVVWDVSIFNGVYWREGPSLPYIPHGKSTLVIPKQLATRLHNYKPC